MSTTSATTTAAITPTATQTTLRDTSQNRRASPARAFGNDARGQSLQGGDSLLRESVKERSEARRDLGVH
jgi:hypothetical protein